MCDTIVALGNSTTDGNVLFAKNSDREPNEAHEVVIIPAANHAAGETVKCTYVEIPQVEHTYRVLLAKPFWIWGAEMGSNEFGVTIGNEAVFTRTAYGKEPGLIGMDFLRLALERARSAEQAMKVIIDLLESYGQGGNCGFVHKLYYHNSFLICDTEEAWVLETSGSEWAAEQVTDVRSISNAITIGKHWDLASENLVKNAVDKGWCKREADFDFAACYSEPIYTRFSDARRRQVCTTAALVKRKGRLTPLDMMSTLRTHQGDGIPGWSPGRGITGADVCMHAGWGPVRGSQTAGSMVSVLSKYAAPVHWVTGTAAPCTSLFKPVWLDAGMPDTGMSPKGEYDDAALYWRHEALHRAILRDYPTRIKLIREQQVTFETQAIERVQSAVHTSQSERFALSGEFIRHAEQVEEEWTRKVQAAGVETRNPILYQRAWKKLDTEAKML
jgi:dipeptidase